MLCRSSQTPVSRVTCANAKSMQRMMRNKGSGSAQHSASSVRGNRARARRRVVETLERSCTRRRKLRLRCLWRWVCATIKLMRTTFLLRMMALETTGEGLSCSMDASAQTKSLQDPIWDIEACMSTCVPSLPELSASWQPGARQDITRWDAAASSAMCRHSGSGIVVQGTDTFASEGRCLEHRA